MITQLLEIVSDSSTKVRSKLFGIYGVLIAINVLAWIWAVVAFRDHPVLLGTALLAYGFGLRHAVDADHIAAIDNVTRKLMQEKQAPRRRGLLLFARSLHCRRACLCRRRHGGIRDEIAFRPIPGNRRDRGNAGIRAIPVCDRLMNLIILTSIYRAWRHVRSGGKYVEDDFDMLLANRGFFARLFRPLFRMITRSWHMYPLGFLFGLGFDTATEIGLLGIAATQASRGLSPWAIMVFPVLFSAGMSLIDTLDGH